LTPVITEVLTKEKYLSQRRTPSLKEASDETCPLFKGTLTEMKYLCHNDPNLINPPDLVSLG
jgi:hypothetical protein